MDETDQNPQDTRSDMPAPASNGSLVARISLWMSIARLTLREPLLRMTGHLALLVVIALGVWAARLGWNTLPQDPLPVSVEQAEAAAITELPAEKNLGLSELPPFSSGSLHGASLVRSTGIHTVFPERPRMDVIKYEVQAGDTLFGIADKFSLKPESVLWGNDDILRDDPHRLSPEQILKIPPVDGTLYVWHAGDGLNGVARFFGVDPQDILTWPGNNLDPNMDTGNPEIEAGTVLMVPGGHRELVSWSAPRITRAEPGRGENPRSGCMRCLGWGGGNRVIYLPHALPLGIRLQLQLGPPGDRPGR